LVSTTSQQCHQIIHRWKHWLGQSLMVLLELITFQCQKQTHKRQKILTRQFSLDQESASTVTHSS
jgi:hypothetical protein